MQENTNKAIVFNSLILYAKLIITTITGLITTRYALKALGVDDFGLFSVLGSIITFIAIFNTIMLSASNRFISVAIGCGSLEETNEQFNINLTIHVAIAVITLLIAIPAGDWYILNYVHYAGSIENAVNVFHYAVIGSVISFVGVPYNGLLMAKERFWVFSLTDVVTHVLKMIVAIMLVNHFENKLDVYAFSQAGLTAVATLVYFLYCKKNFSDIVRLKVPRNKSKYKEMFLFSSWVSFGAIATVGKSQGAAILVNAFFNTAMNTALGLANTVNALIMSFANNIDKPIAPQITKSYATGNMERCTELVIMSIKFTFLVMLLISAPFLVNSYWIYNLWLGQVPDYVESFVMLVIIDALVTSLNSGLSNLIFASGKIKIYQLSINTLRLAAILGAYFALKISGEPLFLLYSYIIISIIIFFAGQMVLKRTLDFDTSILWKQSYIPCLIVSALFVPCCFIPSSFYAIPVYIAVEIYLCVLIYFIALNEHERKVILGILKKISKK